MLYRPPQPLDKDIVLKPPTAIHADLNIMFRQHLRKRIACNQNDTHINYLFPKQNLIPDFHLNSIGLDPYYLNNRSIQLADLFCQLLK